jgi:hypothetical protein
MNWDKMANDLRKIRSVNENQIALRRGSEELDEQPMRIEFVSTRGFRVMSDAAREARQAVIILGEPDMDIAIEDRLTHDEVLYRVAFIQPNRRAGTLAEAVAVL